MVKNNKFWKKLARLAGWLTVLVALALFFSGCTSMPKISKSQEEEIARINQMQDKIQNKILILALLEPNSPAARQQEKEICDERKNRNDMVAALLVKLGIGNKELDRLASMSWEDIVKWITKNLPDLAPKILPWLKEWFDGLKNSYNDMQQGVQSKLQNYSQVLDNELAIIDQLKLMPPGDPNRAILFTQLVEQQALATQIDLTPELELVGQIVKKFENLGPFPVVAGTTVDRCSFIIAEGHPPDLMHLDDGILAPGSEIIIQLPPDWILTAPATIEPNNNNLTLDICGNEPCSSLIKMRVVSEFEPNRPDDSITVTFNGIQIGNRTGIVRGSLTVLPGRTSTTDFVVLPPGCRPPPLADMTYDGTVNFKDLAVLANEWLMGTAPGYPVVDNPLPECPTVIPGFKIRSIKVGMGLAWPSAGYAAMNQLLDTGQYPAGIDGEEEGTRIEQFVNLHDSSGRGEFTNDQTFPGIDDFQQPTTDPAGGPPSGPDDDNYFATEILACIDLTAGLHIIGVNSDDGAIVKVGGVEVGRTAEFKSASTVDFTFEVVTAGKYRLQVRSFVNAGGAELELHEILVTPGGRVRILLGDVERGGSPVYAFP
jgi:hypothetical protein